MRPVPSSEGDSLCFWRAGAPNRAVHRYWKEPWTETTRTAAVCIRGGVLTTGKASTSPITVVVAASISGREKERERERERQRECQPLVVLLLVVVPVVLVGMAVAGFFWVGRGRRRQGQGPWSSSDARSCRRYPSNTLAALSHPPAIPGPLL
jgi:hypothetical protein